MVLEAPLALVTGGGRGIGRGICLELARAGFAVAINFRAGHQPAEETRADCLAAGAPWSGVFGADVGALADHSPMLQAISEQTGRIDLLVNNAGISSPVRGDMLEVTEENYDRVLATNLKGPFFLSQEVAERMIEWRTAGVIDRPVIINISSISAYVASVARSEYCVSKAGLSMLTQLLAHRLAEEGIVVYEIRPGIIKSDMTKGAIEKYDRLIAEGLTPIRRWGAPEDVGRAVVTLATGKLPFTTGQVINIDGGLHLRHL